MANEYGFFDASAGTPAYAGAQFRKWVSMITGGGGVMYGWYNNLAPTAPETGLTVEIDTGGATVGGGYIITDAATTLTFDAEGAGNDRIDLAVVRCTVATKLVELAVVKGTASGTPSAPALTNTSAVQEIVLCEVFIGGGETVIHTADITDSRTYVNYAQNILYGTSASPPAGDYPAGTIYVQYIA